MEEGEGGEGGRGWGTDWNDLFADAVAGEEPDAEVARSHVCGGGGELQLGDAARGHGAGVGAKCRKLTTRRCGDEAALARTRWSPFSGNRC